MESISVDIEVPKPPPPPARLNSGNRSRSHSRLPRFNSKRTLSQDFDDEEPSPSDSPGDRTTTPLTSHDLSSADMLMAGGVQAMNHSLAEVIEDALGAPIPSVEVRFKDVRLVARIPVASTAAKANELPTLWNQVVKGVNGCFSKQNIVEKEILRGITGSFKPGRITLVLGQPGSGKSALMKIISGRFPMTENITLSGDIKFNDLTRDDHLAYIPRFVSYVNQTDQHYARMTVLETFQFAHKCCAGDGLEPWMIEALKNCTAEQHEQALQVIAAHHKYAPELVVKKLGLDNCKDTVVGDDMLRGVSGGERKRVTTGEMAFGLVKVHMMDEISTGLDSAAAYDIVNSFKSMAVNFKSTIVISLLQPSPEVFELFDDLIVLNDGHIMFQGECKQALPYFEGLGFQCPPRRDVADFLLDLGTNKQHVYAIPNFPRSIPYHAEDFANQFRQSEIFRMSLACMETPIENSHDEVLGMKPFRQNFPEELVTLVRRQLLLTLRNTAYLGGRAVMVIINGLLYGTTFWQMDDSSAQLVLGLLFSSAMFLSMGQAAQVATFMDERMVFYKQRGANFFRSGTYVLASSMTQIPFAILETVIFGLCVYWMGGYVDDFGRFLVFLLTLFLCQIFFTAYFFFLSSSMPNLTIAQPIMIVSILFFVLFGGFLIAKDDIADYFIWIYWINPLNWCIRALSINEYMAPKFKVCVYKDVNYCETYNMNMGEYSLSLFNLPSDTVWIYYAWIFFVAGYFLWVLSAYLALEFKRYESPENVSAFDEKLDADVDAKDGYVVMPTTPKLKESTHTVSGQTDDIGIVGPTIAVPIDDGARREIIPATLAFENLWYSVPMPGSHDHEEIDLLKGVSGFALPGTMTALMGSSGAGKTTLMDVIAGRKTGGTIKGKILLNGYPANELAISRCTGYCEQMDIHSDSATIREALTFSALLRQDASVSNEEKLASVQECIELLELGSIADQIIRGSSTEQMKRLTIGVELAADPSILFMDEPTSGLDARSAKLIMDGVRKIADTGRTVVCTIHQPSYEVFALFDSLLLLQRGGRMVYFGELGENSSNLIKYFEAIPEVKPIKPGYNPATWMLECIGAGVGNEAHSNFADLFEASDKKQLMVEDLDQDGVTRPSKYLPEILYATKRAANSQVQFYLLLQRFFRMYWRTPTYSLTRLMITLLLGALYAIIYQGTDFTTYTGVNTGIGMVFTSTSFVGMIGFNSVMPVAADERTAFYRERASQTYNALWYFIAGTIAEIPYVALSAFIFSVIIFPSVGFTGYSTFFMYWLVVGLNLLLHVYLGQMLIYALPSIEVAQVIGMLLVSIFMLFAGFNPPTNSIPDAYIWIHYISPPTYAIAILAAIIFADCPDADSSNFGCLTMSQAPPSVGTMTIKEYVEGTFTMNYDDIARNAIVICCLIVAFRLLALVSLRYVNHQKR